MANGENSIKKRSPPEFIEADGITYVPLPDGGVLEVRGSAVYYPPEAAPRRYQEASSALRRLLSSRFDLIRNSDPYERQSPREGRFFDLPSIIDLSDLKNALDRGVYCSPYLNPGKKDFYNISDISPPKNSNWIERDDEDRRRLR